jgi:hypothetical protein
MIRRNLYSVRTCEWGSLASANFYGGERESMKGVRLITICLAALLVLGGLLGVTASAGAARGAVAVSPETAAAEAAEEAAETAAEANEAAEESAIAAGMRAFPGWEYRIRHLKYELHRIRVKRGELRGLPRTERRAEVIAQKTEKIHEVRAHLLEVRKKFKEKKKEAKG